MADQPSRVSVPFGKGALARGKILLWWWSVFASLGSGALTDTMLNRHYRGEPDVDRQRQMSFILGYGQ